MTNWTPINGIDDVPENYEPVLVASYTNASGCRIDTGYAWRPYDMPDEVIAWQSLPEPYEEVEK